ncbi:MAG TPA: preprotein translocase subunit SecE, partial [Gemmata sp.]
TKIAGSNPPKGMHGGIFLMVSAAITIFFISRAFALNIEGKAGWAVGGVVALGLAYLAVRFFTGQTGAKWMATLEEQGWFSTHQYKRSLGLKVRRLTILGVLILGGSGAWSLYSNGTVPEFWTLTMPFEVREAPATLTKTEFRNGVAHPVNQFELAKNAVLVMTGAKLAVPLLIIGVTLWVAFRAVNVPDFAEFLIATEAEMNKVSWSTRKRLAQDTVVVLVTTLLMTVFLLAVDLFWGWLLSRQTVGVLPARATNQDKGAQVREAKW